MAFPQQILDPFQNAEAQDPTQSTAVKREDTLRAFVTEEVLVKRECFDNPYPRISPCRAAETMLDIGRAYILQALNIAEHGLTPLTRLKAWHLHSDPFPRQFQGEGVPIDHLQFDFLRIFRLLTCSRMPITSGVA
jgi:hypothetical protein